MSDEGDGGDDGHNYGEPDGKQTIKVIIVCVIIVICVCVALLLLVSSIFSEYSELHVFHHGFLGRQLMMEEGRLVRSEEGHHLTKYSRVQQQEGGIEKTGNGGCSSAGNLFLLDESSNTPGSLQCLLPGVVADELEHEPVGAWQGEQPLPPGTRLLDDDLPEWQEMNYMLRISQPPDTCREFFLQFHCGARISADDTVEKLQDERRNLYNQFRSWKSLRRKRFNVVVTQRAKKEMAQAEKAQQAKLNQRVKFENAQHHRRLREAARVRREEKMWREGKRA